MNTWSIKKHIVWKNWTAVYECEHCGDLEIGDWRGTNPNNPDDWFEKDIVPKYFCHKCGKNRAGDKYLTWWRKIIKAIKYNFGI